MTQLNSTRHYTTQQNNKTAQLNNTYKAKPNATKCNATWLFELFPLLQLYMRIIFIPPEDSFEYQIQWIKCFMFRSFWMN